MICKTCNSEMKLVPQGVSKKTGKPYNAFYSCPNNRERGCKTVPYAPQAPQTNEKREDGQTLEQRVEVLIDEVRKLTDAIKDNIGL